MQEPTIDSGSVPPEIGMSVVRGCLIVPVQVDLHDDTVLRMRADILKRVESAGVKATVIDLSAVRVLDTFAFEALAATARMASLLGATTFLAGLQPGVVSALVDLDVKCEGIHTALSLEDALERLEPTAPCLAGSQGAEDGSNGERVVDGAESGGEGRGTGADPDPPVRTH